MSQSHRATRSRFRIASIVAPRIPSVGAVFGLLLLLSGSSSSAATYHASDCGPGSDAQCIPGDDGRSPSQARNPNTPWRSATKLKDYYLSDGQCGDQFLMAKGGSFEAVTWWSKNLDCRTTAEGGSSEHIVWGAYTPPWASGDEDKPLCRGCHLMIVAPSIAQQGLDIENIHFDGGNYTRTGLTFALFTGPKAYIYIQDNEIENYWLGVQGWDNDGPLGTDFHFLRNNMHHIGQHGFIAYTGNNWKIKDNTFDRISCLDAKVATEGDFLDACVFQHMFYIDSPEMTGVEISRNIFTNIGVYYDSVLEYEVCSSIGGRRADGIQVTDNTWINTALANQLCGAWGNDGNNAYIARNKIVGFPVAITLGGTGGPLNNSTVENNLIILKAGGEDGGYSRAIVMGNADNTNNIIRNNSVYVEPQTGGSFGNAASETVTTRGAGHTVVSNAVHNANTLGGNTCFLYEGEPALALTEADNNTCHYSDGASGSFANGQSLTQWKSSTLWDDDSTVARPGFANPPIDLSLGSASASAADSGHPTRSAPSDILGASRVGPPDIGAFEYSGGAAPPLSVPAAPVLLP